MKKTAVALIAFSFFVAVVTLAGAFFVPNQSFAQTPTPLNISINLDNPLNGPLGNTNTIQAFVALALNGAVLLLTPVVVVMLLYSGLLFITARGNGEKLSSAKKALLYTLIGAAIVLGAKGLALVIQNAITCLGGATTGC